MTTPTDHEARTLLIKKLLNKAEAKGTTPEEREAFNAKAAKLMIQWGIEEALARGATEAEAANIVRKIFTVDAPVTYSYEMCLIGYRVAEVLGCKPVMQKLRGKKSGSALIVIGFEADVDRVGELFASLTRQCTLELGTFIAQLKMFITWQRMSGTEKFRAKRGFMNGYANAAADKLKLVLEGVIAETPGTDIVLRDRSLQVKRWVDEHVETTSSIRRYDLDAVAHGHAAGQRADIGQGTVGSDTGSTGIGG